MALDILIVDDEQDIRDLVSGVLDDEGYGTRTAASADEALAALDERLPSLILLMYGCADRPWTVSSCFGRLSNAIRKFP